MEEVILKEVLNVVVDIKQEVTNMKQELNQRIDTIQDEMKEMKQELNQRMDIMQDDINDMKIEMKEMKQEMQEMKVDMKVMRWEQLDTIYIVKAIINELGEMNKKIKSQSGDKFVS